MSIIINGNQCDKDNFGYTINTINGHAHSASLIYNNEYIAEVRLPRSCQSIEQARKYIMALKKVIIANS